MMDSLLEQWQPRPVQAVKRFQSITFGGLTLEGTKSWKFYDIEHDATVTASVTPRAVPDRFKTIQKAIDEAVEDEVLWIGPGIYCEKLRICKSVSLVAEEGNVTLLQPDHKESEQSEADKLTPVVWVAPRYGGQVLLSELRIEGLGSSEADLANLSVTPWDLDGPATHYEAGAEPHYRCKGIEVVRGRLKLWSCHLSPLSRYLKCGGAFQCGEGRCRPAIARG